MTIRVETLEDSVRFGDLTLDARQRLTGHWARTPEYNEYVRIPEGEWLVATRWLYIWGTPVAPGEQFRLLSRECEKCLWEVRKK